MPSPFPGMDPYIEGQNWMGFHNLLIGEIQRALVPLVRPRYIPFVEAYIYVERDPTLLSRVLRPDITLTRTPRAGAARGEPGVAVLDSPVSVPIASGAWNAASAAALPPPDPPGTRSVSHGLRVGP